MVSISIYLFIHKMIALTVIIKENLIKNQSKHIPYYCFL